MTVEHKRRKQSEQKFGGEQGLNAGFFYIHSSALRVTEFGIMRDKAEY
jgi:hypothetical protein